MDLAHCRLRCLPSGMVIAPSNLAPTANQASVAGPKQFPAVLCGSQEAAPFWIVCEEAQLCYCRIFGMVAGLSVLMSDLNLISYDQRGFCFSSAQLSQGLARNLVRLAAGVDSFERPGPDHLLNLQPGTGAQLVGRNWDIASTVIVWGYLLWRSECFGDRYPARNSATATAIPRAVAD